MEKFEFFKAYLTRLEVDPSRASNISDVVESIGVSRRTFYNIFLTKDDFIMEFYDYCYSLFITNKENDDDYILKIIECIKYFKNMLAIVVKNDYLFNLFKEFYYYRVGNRFKKFAFLEEIDRNFILDGFLGALVRMLRKNENSKYLKEKLLKFVILLKKIQEEKE